MPEKRSRLLVIDASVVSAATEAESSDPTPKACREFLESVYSVCHRVAVTPAIHEEWEAHLSRWTRKWRVYMWGRKKIEEISPTREPRLEHRIDSSSLFTEKQKEALKKDLLLVLACLECDRIIVSRDTTARGLYAKLCGDEKKIRDIVWVNPEEEGMIAWLEKGAPSEEKLKIGAALGDI